MHGYETLLPALAREIDAELRVHRFRVAETSYIAFTDISIERLIAVITTRFV